MFGLTAAAHKPERLTMSDVSFALRHALIYEARAVEAKTMTEYAQCILAVEHWQELALEYERQLLA